MKNIIKFITIILFFLLIPFLLLSNEINFFVNYNIITFSSFDNFINSKSPNFNIYLEYNPLILIYLNWDKKYLIPKLKDKIDNDKIKLFKIKTPSRKTTPAEKWFFNLQKGTDQKLFSSIKKDKNILLLDKPDDNINILNLKETATILQTVLNNKIKKKLDFKINLSLFLYEKITPLLSIIQKYKNFKFNLFVCSDIKYTAANKDINKFTDLVYSIKSKKKINKYEKKVYDLTLMLFSIKLFDHINDLMLGLYPLTKNFKKEYNTASMEYKIKDSKYITLFDKESYFAFDSKTGYLKKWFLYDKGESLINFNSLIEKIYIRGKKNTTQVDLKTTVCENFPNGLKFKFDSPDSIQIEKNIILQHKKIFLTYKIRNNRKKTRKITFILENRFSPSLLDSLVNLKTDFAFNNYKHGLTAKYTGYVNSFINLNTGYGISWDYFNKPDGIEFFKDFYNFTKRIYYKFTLYPFEQKVITISYKTRYVKEKARESFISKKITLTNQYIGDYNIE